ncbi:hypothetical protein SAMN04487904_101236 [Actinopolyspora lacussalsi subsp. righensis]|uniref:Uncharacterized protein n=1 Tax=Actinopolyspora righensis TaxID=995060 RepID=A0A1I6X752_9ACTN|nr:hypothetical protein [Actinopolyspora righensis]SFT33741.1 hypothetical protein SAMN04487904_101236 [Actinopolyspora righensis]
MLVSKQELKKIFDDLLEHASVGRENLEIETDYYWSVPAALRDKVYDDSPELTIGQVSESWENLREILRGESDPIGYGLVWLGDVLHVIGDESIG